MLGTASLVAPHTPLAASLGEHDRSSGSCAACDHAGTRVVTSATNIVVLGAWWCVWLRVGQMK